MYVNIVANVKPETALAPKIVPVTLTPVLTVMVMATATRTPKPTREAEKASTFIKAIANSFEPRIFKIGDQINFGGRRTTANY